MAKRTVYECDICKKETHRGNINIFKRKFFDFFGSTQKGNLFYICDYCLEDIRNQAKER